MNNVNTVKTPAEMDEIILIFREFHINIWIIIVYFKEIEKKYILLKCVLVAIVLSKLNL